MHDMRGKGTAWAKETQKNQMNTLEDLK
jgi:hypothetical protein